MPAVVYLMRAADPAEWDRVRSRLQAHTGLLQQQPGFSEMRAFGTAEGRLAVFIGWDAQADLAEYLDSGLSLAKDAALRQLLAEPPEELTTHVLA